MNEKALAALKALMQPVPSHVPGLIEQGNIDLRRRPVVQNPDGTVSTVLSTSFGQDGREVLVPRVSDEGQVLSDADAWQLYLQKGQHLGVFDTPSHADRYAEELHRDYARGKYK